MARFRPGLVMALMYREFGKEIRKCNVVFRPRTR